MSEYAVGGPIPADAPLPQLDNSYVVPKRYYDEVVAPKPGAPWVIPQGVSVDPDLADLVERHMIVAFVRIADKLSTGLLLPDIAADVLAVLQPLIRPYAEALAASMAAGETPEQFAERLAALEIKES